MQKATLRLFNAIQINERSSHEIDKTHLERTIKNGFIVDAAIRASEELLELIESVVGISGEKANATFHKSWLMVQDSPIEGLVIQQIIHYITTYGFEQLGIYDREKVYIPHEMLQLPEIRADIPLAIVRGMTAQEILSKIVALGSGIALAQDTLDDIMTIVQANSYASEFVGDIKNRELKTLLNDWYGIVPAEPVEFLRYLISKLTNESLLIKNDYLISKIKKANGKYLDELLKNAPDDLASIFFRYKPLFLAMKTISRNKTFFNRLRKKADQLHKPLPADYLNSVTNQIKNGILDQDTLREKLKNATLFRKIRLAYALHYRLHPCDSIVYRVRNGRGWAAGFAWPHGLEQVVQSALEIVMRSITNDIRVNVEGKTIFIPAHICYALPATEKQFTGFLPSGSYAAIPEDMVVGIHWTNTAKRVDLDLSVVGETGKIGWDASYRSTELDVLFSGDMTNAEPPNGATEVFYLRSGRQEPRVMFVNYYNFRPDDDVKAKILVAHEKPAHFSRNYMVNINNIIAQATVSINKKQNILGLIINDGNENQFYFFNTSIGNSITASQKEYSTHIRKYMVRSLTNSLAFREILLAAGANVVNEQPALDYIDLSPGMLDKTTILNLIRTS